MKDNIKKFIKEAESIVDAETAMDLVHTMEQVLADTFVFYFKSHAFHWNVRGLGFSQYHAFFGDIYETVFDSVDTLAEHIRMLGSPAPRSITDMIHNTTLMENDKDLSIEEMLMALSSDNQKILGGLLAAQKMAEAANQVGLANYLQDQFNYHKKLAWQLTSSLG